MAGLALLLISSTLLASEEDKIATDRPDFVESSATVGKNRFQVETSIAFDTKKADGLEEDSYTTPTLLRYGFADVWEARPVLKNHLEADMMHDAIRADVIFALYASKDSNSTNYQEAANDLKEHATELRARVESNAALPIPVEIRSALKQVKPAL